MSTCTGNIRCTNAKSPSCSKKCVICSISHTYIQRNKEQHLAIDSTNMWHFKSLYDTKITSYNSVVTSMPQHQKVDIE